MRRSLALLPLVVACTTTADAPATTTDAGTTTAGPTTTDQPTPTSSLPDLTTTDLTTSTTAPPDTSTTTTPVDTASTTTDTSSTTTPPATCGDGVLDPGEQCDAGPDNSNTGHCTLFCKDALCGDGLVGPDEQCDAGPDNKDGAYNICQSDCTPGPHCGDAIVQPEEECDFGDKNGTDELPIDGVPCTQSCNHNAALVFLSDATFSVPDLGYNLHDIDKRCQELAAAAHLWNAAHFKAWISADNSDVNSRFKPEVKGLRYALLNGLRIANDRTALFQQGPEHGITITETGSKLLDVRVWTDTNPDGTLFDPELDCKEWQTNSPVFKARVGRSGVDENDDVEFEKWQTGKQWTNHVTLGCHHKYHLYCFED